MTPSNLEPDRRNAPTSALGDEIQLHQLVRAIWRHRRVPVVLAVLGALLGLALSLYFTRFVAEGLLLTPQLELRQFKQYEVALGNEERIAKFIKFNELEGTQTADALRALGSEPGAVARAVRPVFEITGREAKAYDISTAESGGLIGIQLTLARKKLTKESPIQRLADYVRHTMIEVDLQDVMLNECLLAQTREQFLRIEQLKSDFAVSQDRKRAARLRSLIAELPEASANDGRQIVTLKPGNEKFLSPSAQLVAVELSISEAALDTEKRERERVAASLRSRYYCGARDLQQSPRTGQAFLVELAALSDNVFEQEDRSRDIVEQVQHELALQRQAWTDRYLERTRFVVAPDGGEQRRREPPLAVAVALGALVGAAGGIVLALMMGWWRDNRDAVIGYEVG